MNDPAAGHIPVLAEPVVRLLAPQPGQTILDGTTGLGGHAELLIPRILPGGRYIGMDLDEQMLQGARQRLSRLAGVEPQTLALFKGNFADFAQTLQELGLDQVDHMLLDLGVNSAQLEDPRRGFSFEREGPLDMRFDRDQQETALDLVNRLSERELADLFYRFGQEGASRRIAKRICEFRHLQRIRTTTVLAKAVESAISSLRGGRQGRIHPATRVFQALRVAVNRELENLERFLEQVIEHLRPGGRLAVISFHSLEDGIVKRFMRQARAEGSLRELTKRPIIADPQERETNPRSRSAKLRVAERT